VQILLASLNSLKNQSGLNKKSAINNTNFEDPTPDQSAPQECNTILRKLYEIFWTHLPFLSNPFLFLEQPTDSTAPKEKVLNLLRSFTSILEYFKNNPIQEEEPVIRRFPKYIRDINLFHYQINEPYFRKTVLIQLKFLLFNIENQLAVYSKSFEPFSEAEQKEVKQFDELLSFLLRLFKPFGSKSKRHLQEILSRLLNSEKEWMRWKEEGCKPYSKHFSEKDLQRFRRAEPLVDLDATDAFMAQKQREIRGWLNLEQGFEHKSMLSREALSVASLHPDLFQAVPAQTQHLLLRPGPSRREGHRVQSRPGPLQQERRTLS